MECSSRDDNLGLSCHIKQGVVLQRPDFNQGRARCNIIRIYNPDHLVGDKEIVV